MERPSGAHGDSEEQGLIRSLRKQMVSIISRVAEHVREVQDEVQELKRDLAQGDDRERGERTAIDKNSPEMLTLRDSLKKVGCQLEQLDRDVATSNRERGRLEAAHEATKSDLVAFNERHLRIANELSDVAQAGTDTQRSVQQLVRDHGKAEAALPLEVGRLEKLIPLEVEKLMDSQKLQHTSRAVSNTEIKAQFFQESLDYQEETSKKIDELISWKGEAVALMKDASRSVADLEAELKLLKEASIDQKEVVAKSFRSVDDTLHSLQVRNPWSVDVQQRHEKQLKASETDIGQLQESLGDLKETVQLLSTNPYLKHRQVMLTDPRADLEKPVTELDRSKLTSPRKASNMSKLGSRFDHSTKNISEVPRILSRGRSYADDHGLHSPKAPRLPDVPGRTSPQYGLPGH